MELLFVLLVVAVVFGLCWLVDKAFTKLFRSKVQHVSGLSVRLNKRYGTAGVLLFVLGIMAIFAGIPDNTVLWAGGALILITGVGLVVYYLSFGIFYDEDSFLITGFGKKGRTYQYNQIKTQQLYEITGGNLLVELHMSDGSAVQIYSQMVGTKAFMDKAFLGWVRQNNIDIRETDCDPDEYRWFPSEEEK